MPDACSVPQIPANRGGFPSEHKPRMFSSDFRSAIQNVYFSPRGKHSFARGSWFCRRSLRLSYSSHRHSASICMYYVCFPASRFPQQEQLRNDNRVVLLEFFFHSDYPVGAFCTLTLPQKSQGTLGSRTSMSLGVFCPSTKHEVTKMRRD